MPLLESLEDRDTLSVKEFDKALDKLNKRYIDVAKPLGLTAAAIYSWVHTVKNIPRKHRSKVLNLLIKWKGEMNEKEQSGTTVDPDTQVENTVMKDDEKKEPDTLETVTEDEPEEKPDEEETEDKIQEPEYNYDPLKKRRTSLGLNQEICAGAIKVSPWTFSYKERRLENYSFSKGERKTLEAFFDHLERIRESGFALTEKKETTEQQLSKDMDFALKMLRQHINHMQDGVIKNMTKQYLSFIEEELNS